MDRAAGHEIAERRRGDQRVAAEQGLEEVGQPARGDVRLRLDLLGPHQNRRQLRDRSSRTRVAPGRLEGLRAAEVEAGVEAGRRGGARPCAAMREVGRAPVIDSRRCQAHHELMLATSEVRPALQPLVEPLVVGGVRVQGQPGTDLLQKVAVLREDLVRG